jgi:hypothetical protein
VIFFCGAGISRARARLPDFFELAERVMNGLGTGFDSPARKLVAAARDMKPIAGVTGVISADRIFSLLEREFTVKDINREVAVALRPGPDADLSAHKTLLDLGRGPDRKIRLVTTNFDLLFETANPRLSVWEPPNLPDPTRQTEFAGIVHLHGRVDSSYQGALGDSFILSSAEFGRAYLSDGWATQFIRAVTDNYLVVFLGYTADDPPVQYLLEALYRTSANQTRLFAFQSGTESEAESRWRHKGVHAIAYDGNDAHRALWNTLEAWAGRARNPAGWYDGVIRLARRGPEKLLPHERGQLVHMVTNRDGASRFVSAQKPPPATWLCVFDPACRYEKPGRLNLLQLGNEAFDPFDAYGLDTDPIPPKIDPSDYLQKREVPENVLDAFALTPLDREDLRDASSSAFRGQGALGSAAIPPRLGHLAAWLAKVANQPAAVWWAAGQRGLNPAVQSYVQSQLQRPERECAPAIRHAWQYLFESWRTEAAREVLNNYAVKQVIEANGWNALAVKYYGELCRPYLKVTRPFWTGPKPPNHSKNVHFRDVVHVEIEFPHLDLPITVPDKHLAAVLVELRQNLGRVVALGADGFHGVASSDLPPIEPDPNLAGFTSTRDLGLSGTVTSYLTLFRRLLEVDPKSAEVEAQTWLGHDDPVFTRLAIWACNDPRLVPDDRIGPTLATIGDDGFWNWRHERDLLLALEKRWAGLPQPAQKQLEARFRKGPKRWPKVSKVEFEQYRSIMILNRLYWLHQHQCDFNFDLETVAAPLRAKAPTWRPDFAANAAASREPRGGWVHTDKTHANLRAIPVGSVLAVAARGRDREHGPPLEHNPFAGLAAERPVRALTALLRTIDGQEYVRWGWQTLLSFEARQHDKPRFVVLLARRLAHVPDSILTDILAVAAFWLHQSRRVLFEADREGCLTLWDRLVGVLENADPSLRASNVVPSLRRDWITEAINASAGKLAETLRADPNLNSIAMGAGLPPEFAHRAERLLRLPDEAGRYALVIFGSSLNWFFAIDTAWTEANLLNVLGQNDDDREALISGFLHHPRVTGRTFYARLIPILIQYVVALAEPTSLRTAASDVLLGGWLTVEDDTGERWLSSERLRDVVVRTDNNVRVHMLWQVARWSSVADKITFLTEVWPRQTVAKNPAVTRRLCEVALDDEDHFPELLDAALPLMSRPDGTSSIVPHFSDRAQNVLRRFPKKFLMMLWEILPEDATKWPYGIDGTIDLIAATDTALLHNARLIELKRRWNARRM